MGKAKKKDLIRGLSFLRGKDARGAFAKAPLALPQKPLWKGYSSNFIRKVSHPLWGKRKKGAYGEGPLFRASNFFEKMLDILLFCGIMKLLHKLNIGIGGIFVFTGAEYPFLTITILDFGKSAGFSKWLWEIPQFQLGLCSDKRSLRFSER